MEMIMNQATSRQLLFSVMAGLLLIASCAPVPAATEDSALAQQAIDQSVALTVAAKDIQAKDQQLTEQSAALTGVAQNAQAAGPGLETPASGGEVTIPEGLAPLTSTATLVMPTLEPPSNSTPDPNAPTIKSISPNMGFTVGGTPITITGTNFIPGDGFTHFLFGDKEATNVVCESTTKCTAKVPEVPEDAQGIVTVKVFLTQNTPGQKMQADTFVYLTLDPNAPVIDSISPNGGSTAGGTAVTVKGSNFVPGTEDTRFYFGANQATDVTCESETECIVISPAGQEGYVLVVAGIFLNGVLVESQHVEDEDGTSDDGFKYSLAPQLGCSVFTSAPSTTAKTFVLLRSGENFVIKWIIRNTGENPWPAGLDFRYSSGVNMGDRSSVEIPGALKPNESYTVRIDAAAPTNPGKYYMTWTVEGIGCNGYIAVSVE
jgi:hypothetical protein